MKRNPWLVLGWLLALGWSSTWADVLPSGKIPIPNAEDLALVADDTWVIASSMPAALGDSGGGLYGVEVVSGRVVPLQSDRKAVDSGSWAGCPAPESPQHFSPHGIAAHVVDGREWLFVVNHGQRESVEIYEIEVGDTLTLRWLDCLELPAGASANAVAAIPDGRVFVTNMNDLEPEPGESDRWMGNVLVWAADSGWTSLPGSRLYAPNGLLVADDGATVYVASWAGGEVTRWAEGDQAALPLPFLPDNLRWQADHTLLATGLRGTPDEVVACLMGQGLSGREKCDAIHTTVARVNITGDRLELDCIRELSLSMGTTAIPVGMNWWVGPVRGENIWVVKDDAESCRNP